MLKKMNLPAASCGEYNPERFKIFFQNNLVAFSGLRDLCTTT
jgi:hypothetical protein